MRDLFFLFIGFISCYNGIAQTYSDEFQYKAVYELTYQPDSTDIESTTSEEMWLYLGDRVSRFSSKGKALKDSLSGHSIWALSDLDAQEMGTITEFDYLIYKDFPQERISYTLEIVDDQLRYEEDKALFEWAILPETKVIQGYQSQKAKTSFRGREYTAWFTSEIPIPDGPYKFNGLPGLILQIHDSKNDYVFKLKEFGRLKETIPVELDTEAYMLTSKERLLQIKREYELDPLSGIERRDPNVSISVENDGRRQYLRYLREKLAKKNNPLELE